MIIGSIFSIMPAFVYWLAGTMAANGMPDAPTAGTIVAFTTLQSRLFFPLGQLLNVQVEIQGSLALFDRIFEYLEMDPEIVDAPDAVALDHASVRGRVRFRNVSFRYPRSAVPSSRAHEATATDVEERAVALEAVAVGGGLAGADEITSDLAERADGADGSGRLRRLDAAARGGSRPRSRSRTSASPRSPASSSRSSDRRARARRRRPT